MGLRARRPPRIPSKPSGERARLYPLPSTIRTPRARSHERTMRMFLFMLIGGGDVWSEELEK